MTTAPATALVTVDLPGGVTLPYAERRRPGGIPLLLLHGVTDSWRSFEMLLPHLPTAFRVIAPTQRGHGDASKPATGYAMGDFAADAAALLDALAIESAVIVGHSMGSAVAQRFAVDYPDRTRALVLIGAATSWRNPVMVEVAGVLAGLTDPLDPAFVRAFQESTVARSVPPDFLDAAVTESLKAPARVWQAAWNHLIASDLGPLLGRIRVPTLIAWGDQDGLVPAAEQTALAAAIPGSVRLTYPGVGHAPHWEEPEQMAADIGAFALRAV
jgi:non-heme chloroperoxidase